MKVASHSASSEPEAQPTVPSADMRGLIAYFLRLGTLGFGGRIAVVTFAILTWTKKIPEPHLIVAAGAVGMLLNR
jgi:chromate transport protein ChrA